MICIVPVRQVALFLTLWLAAIHSANAAVTFFGSVSPDPPGNGDVESALIVGLDGANDPDPRGYVRIDGGDQIEYDSLIIGDDEGYRGEVLITGSLEPGRQSRLTLEDQGSASSPTAQIGNEGVGHLTIETGASLLFEDSRADLVVGVEPSGVGIVTVRGDFSLIVIPDSQIIGEEGLGRLEILDGGMVYASDTTNTTLIGATSTGIGTVVVDGTGSIWKIDDDLTIGGSGYGRLLVQDNGIVDIDGPGDVTLIGATGRLELDGGVLRRRNHHR